MLTIIFILICGIPVLDYSMTFPNWQNMKERMEIVYAHKFRMGVAIEIVASILVLRV